MNLIIKLIIIHLYLINFDLFEYELFTINYSNNNFAITFFIGFHLEILLRHQCSVRPTYGSAICINKIYQLTFSIAEIPM